MPEKKYTGEDIRVLEGLDGVRLRPAMYIGSTGKEGLHHLVYEVVDNSVDECLAGICNLIKITIHKDNSITVEDNGRGIPVDMNKQFKKTALELVLTKLHAGGKFDKKAYMISGGLHGVGISVVNALSEKLKVQVKRQGNIYEQEYKRGKTLDKLKQTGKTKDTGTTVFFVPDKEIFSTLEFDFNTLATRLKEIAFLNAGLKIILNDERKNKKEEFHYTGGLVEFVKWLNKTKEAIHSKPIYFKKSTDHTIIEISIQYNSGYQENIFGFVNTINTVEGGTHISGFKTALTRVINDYAKKQNILKTGNLTGDDVREGLTAIVSIKIPEPQFEGQTKTKLGNSEVKGYVDSVVSSALSDFFEENPAIAKKIVNKAAESAKARNAAKKARDLVRRKSAFGLSGLPGKLADCSSKKKDKTELYLVEGESAGGSAKQARNKEIQAILPLKGKILNVEKARLDKMLVNQEIKSLVVALGTAIAESFDLSKIRYHKIVIMTDADVDGAHIRTLLLTLFYRYFPEVVNNGYLYIAQPPLYQVSKGRESVYAYNDAEKDALVKRMGKGDDGKGVNIQRYKGLGEMNPDQLWDTTLNPEHRSMKRVTVADAQEADRLFDILMGSVVAPRKHFIQTHALNVKNLDI
ncbi:TPA: DNA topoisomerase (ATP-hydrolyzing) subunit B [Patescibacteria group bacterium]|nr:DNA topoisomerase (ATP-hydrolyzing) subunit B [Patescibacteria group bacterium]